MSPTLKRPVELLLRVTLVLLLACVTLWSFDWLHVIGRMASGRPGWLPELSTGTNRYGASGICVWALPLYVYFLGGGARSRPLAILGYMGSLLLLVIGWNPYPWVELVGTPHVGGLWVRSAILAYFGYLMYWYAFRASRGTARSSRIAGRVQ
jgi:hypothetical protein